MLPFLTAQCVLCILLATDLHATLRKRKFRYQISAGLPGLCIPILKTEETRQVKSCPARNPTCTGETKDGYCQPLEKAEIVREGGDVTILCYSRMRYVVMQAVQQLEKQGFDPEARPRQGIHV